MLEALSLAVITTFIGLIPFLICRRWIWALATGLVGLLVSWWIYYISIPAFVYPLGVNILPIIIVIFWIVSIFAENGDGFNESGNTMIPGAFVIGFIVIFIICLIFGSGIVRSRDYSQLIGDIAQKEWTQDVQPKDPRHVRLVPIELAEYLATKQLGEVQGAIGSQYDIGVMTLQIINGELWYVAPLDYAGFSVWSSEGSTPGYVMVHAEDPKMPVTIKTGNKFKYMPRAFFGDNLKRHIWKESMFKYDLTDSNFEIDDSGNPWWVVTAYKPTIMWSGNKVFGIYIVNPTTGDTKFYSMEEIPCWVDRVIPANLVQSYIKYYGSYLNGWLNSWWGKKNLIEPEKTTLVYGSDEKPYWVTGITSQNENDSSLVGLIYTETRTGKSTNYHAKGGTESAICELVDNKVSYRKLHGASPVLYNIDGIMTSIVPLLGESHSFQGVAMVDVANMQVATGDNIESTFRQYQKIIMSGSAQKLSPDKSHIFRKVVGSVDRIATEVSGGETIYYIHILDCPHIFTGGSDISSKLKMVQRGDRIIIVYIQSDEDILPMYHFDLPALVLSKSNDQVQLDQTVTKRQEKVIQKEDANTARDKLNNMSDEEILRLTQPREVKK